MLDEAVCHLLPTPIASDSQGGVREVPERRTSNGKDHGPRLRDVAPLLPTPTAVRYGNNQSPSPGAAVRPGLDSIADLLPTPAAKDWKSGNSNIMDRNARPLNEVVMNSLPGGDGGRPPSIAGNGSPDQPLTLWSWDGEETGA